MESNPGGPVGVGHFSALVTVKGGKVKVSVYPRFRDCGSTRELRCRWEGFTLNEVITPCSSSLHMTGHIWVFEGYWDPGGERYSENRPWLPCCLECEESQS